VTIWPGSCSENDTEGTLFDVEDLVRLELALVRFARVHRSEQSRTLVESVREILSAAQARLRVASAVRLAETRAYQ
jgi:hypothetical protein